MIRRFALSAFAAFGLSASAALAAPTGAAVTDYDFSFEGPFGTYDQMQLQRGLQIYTQVCAACHGLQYVPIRAIGDESGPGIPEEQVFAYAEQLFIADELNNPQLIDRETGEMRPLTPNDNFPVNRTADAPDLSLMAKARAGFSGPYGLGINQILFGMGGPEYIASILAGYKDVPECAQDVEIAGTYNYVFPSGGYPDECLDEDGNRTVGGSWIGMGAPLFEGAVDYTDGTPATVEQMAMDVSAFLMWTAEPHLAARKQAGLTGVIFLTILSVLLYFTNKRLWAPIKHARKSDRPAE